MITKNENAKPRHFKGVSFDVLAVGDKLMITRMNFKAGEFVPMHSHPNEQAGYVISGKYKMMFRNENEILIPGDSYSIPGNMEHSLEVIEGGEVIDVFTPPRQDYL